VSTAEEIRYDFHRDVWCLLGLVFDAVDMQTAIEIIERSANMGKKCTFATPNLNFVISALDDQPFRNTVANGQLSLLDGMPLLWVARLLATGISTKVSGSNLFERLWHRDLPEKKRLRVFLFGGESGVAEQACERITNTSTGLNCVGFFNPGFGTIDEISKVDILDAINNSNADFAVVALGARKGQLWIDKNRLMIDVPVLSHLGAVLNFAAGNVKRAPVWMQQTGLEWVWRIVQEPALWKRYFFDGLAFARLLSTRVLPYFVWQKVNSQKLKGQLPVIYSVRSESYTTVFSIQGSCLHSTIHSLRKAFSTELGRSNNIRLDLSGVPVVDGAFLGLCVLLQKYTREGGGELSVSGVNPVIERIIRWNCVEYLL
jgi:N-acetylglucosaminyldiphosphoundecaprenol N-acetyl-beta-D-mannosaminyltransferase